MKKIITFIQLEWLQLLLIVLVAATFRFWHLSALPAALNRDEAALGYNAWMLQTIGVDEWGNHWPIALKSFGDYKLLGYPLATVFSLQVFGKSDWSVRLPSALAGTLLPVAIWYLAAQLQWGRGKRLAAAATVAVLPFSIFYSRMAFEANLALTIVIWSLGLLLDAQAHHSLPKLATSLTLWILAIFTYNTPLLLTPFLIIALVVWYANYSKKIILTASLIGLVGVLVIAMSALWQLNQQKAGISIFTDPTIETHIVENYTNASGIGKLFASRYIAYSGLLVKHYIESWSPHFLVTNGGSHPWHTVPGSGHLTWFVYVFGCFGVLLKSYEAIKQLFKKTAVTVGQRGEGLLLWLLLTGLAPSVITVDAPHGTRSLLFMVLLAFFSILGIWKLFAVIKKYLPKYLILVMIVVVGSALYTTTGYLKHYFYTYPLHQDIFQPGLVAALKFLKPSSKPVLVAGDGYTYISIAWYLPVEPQHFLNTITRHQKDTIGFEPGKSVDKFTIRPDFNTPDAANYSLLEWSGESWLIRK